MSLVLRPSSTPEVSRFHYPGVGDVSSLTSNAAGVVTAEVVGLPGENLVTIAASGWVWAVMNTHGSTQATRTGTTVVMHTWDPYGQPVSPAPAGPFGWLGEHQRHRSVGTVITQMGARPHHPGLGRFLAVDPVEGGVDNDYVYPLDPFNEYDVTGRFCVLGRNPNGSCRGSGAAAVVSTGARAGVGAARSLRGALSRARRILPATEVRLGICPLVCLDVTVSGGSVAISAQPIGIEPLGGAIGPAVSTSNEREVTCELGIGPLSGGTSFRTDGHTAVPGSWRALWGVDTSEGRFRASARFRCGPRFVVGEWSW